jgi:hypothetical protein
VRNGNRWRVAAIDTKTNRVAAERLDDKARVIFDNDYLRDHVTLGYAVTVHSAQGVTADASSAVLGENTSRAMLYVAMTRGRQTNTAHIYERTSGDHEYGHQESDGTHVEYRGDSHEAAGLFHEILANDQPTVTAHDYAARTPAAELPARVRSLLARRATATDSRMRNYHALQGEARELTNLIRQARARQASTGRVRDQGIEL